MVGRKLVKPLIVIAGLGSVFASGMFFQSKRTAEKLLELERERVAAIAQREAEIRAEYDLKLGREATARMNLQADLDALRTREQDLTTRARTLEVSDACTTAATFNGDFVRLWNDASLAPSDDTTANP